MNEQELDGREIFVRSANGRPNIPSERLISRSRIAITYSWEDGGNNDRAKVVIVTQEGHIGITRGIRIKGIILNTSRKPGNQTNLVQCLIGGIPAQIADIYPWLHCFFNRDLNAPIPGEKRRKGRNENENDWVGGRKAHMPRNYLHPWAVLRSPL